MHKDTENAVPYRFKLYTEQTSTNPSNVLPAVDGDDATEILQAIKSINFEYLTYLLRRSIPRNTSDFNLLGSGNLVQQKKILKYLVCLRHGLDRDMEIGKRIKFGKISQLIHLLGRDGRWPEQLFYGKCDDTDTCECDGKGRGCRRHRLFAVALMKLHILRREQAKLKENFEAKYANKLEIQKEMKEQGARSASTVKSAELKDRVNIVLSMLYDNKNEYENKPSATDNDRDSIEDSIEDGYASPNIKDDGKDAEIKTQDSLEDHIPVNNALDAEAPHNEYDEVEERYLTGELEDTTQTYNEPLHSFHRHTDHTHVNTALSPITHVEKHSPTPRNEGETISIPSRETPDPVSTTKAPSPGSDAEISKVAETRKKSKDVKPNLPKIEQEKEKIASHRKKKPKKTRKPKSNIKEKATRASNELNTEEISLPNPIIPTDNTNIQPRQLDYLEVDLETQQSVYKLLLQVQTPPFSNSIRVPSLSHIDLSVETGTIPIFETSRHDDGISESNHSFKNVSPTLPSIVNKRDNTTQSEIVASKVEYSSDSITWSEYRHFQADLSQIFKEKNGQFVFTLDEEIYTRYLRIHSTDNRAINATIKVQGKVNARVGTEEKLTRQTPAQDQSGSGLNSEIQSASTREPWARNISRFERHNARINLSTRKQSPRSISSSEHHHGINSASSLPLTPEKLEVDDEESSSIDDDILPIILSHETYDPDKEEYVNKFDGDLMVNIKRDTPMIHSPHPSTRKQVMFPPITSKCIISAPEVDESAEERRRRRIALNRQRAAKHKLEVMKSSSKTALKNNGDDDEYISAGDKSSDELFRNYKNAEGDFLQKYCIISEEQREFYKYLYNMYEEDKNVNEDDFLSLNDALEAMSIANNSLVSEGMTNYILTVLSLVGLSMSDRLDLKTFMLLLAFSEKVISLGDFFRLNLARIDYANLLICIIKAKRMYTILLRNEDERTIHIEDFLIELQAANIRHNKELFHCVTNEKQTLDFLDYLVYFPLFMLTHSTIIASPVS